MSRFKLTPAVYLVLRQENKILLSRRANSGYGDGMFSLVAGHLEGGETGREAMVREAAEEIGILLKESDLRFVHMSHRLGNTPEEERVDIFYSASWQDEVQNREPEKCSELSWENPKKLPEDTIPFIALVIEDIEQGNTYSEYKTEPRYIIEA